MRRAPAGGVLGGAVALSGVVVAVGLALAAPVHAAALVAPGGAVPVSASGFEPGAAVVLQLAGLAGVKTVHADNAGAVHASYPAPRTAGSYRLLASGSASGQSSAPPGTVVVGVPRVVTIAFQVIGARHSGSNSPSGSGYPSGSGSAGPSDGVSGVSASRAGSSGGLGVLGASTGRAGRASHGTGTLSTTGEDVQRVLEIGAGAVAAGGLLSWLGRRRRLRRH